LLIDSPDSALLSTVQTALDSGCSLAQLEGTLLADGDSEEAAAAWLYAWAYAEVRPSGDDLVARIARG
jgi:hypothetical protein